MSRSAPSHHSSGIPANESTSDKIIGAALTLIGQHGFGAVTMSRIAETAGIARQTLYNHYPDIDSIVAEAINRHNRQAIELLESAMHVAHGPLDKLKQIVRHVVSVSAHTHRPLDVQHGLSADTRSTLVAYDEAVRSHLLEILEEGKATGALRLDLNPEVDVILAQHMLDGIAELAMGSPTESAKIAATGTRTLLAAMASG